ncbi:NAD(P)/FAD-dependent oxidoreductase [Paenibacillus sp. MBLB4367]|uniref:NAD(P)/FAD-dependent oxidoreductase n=1 Tax=Paenibacillus sp. MBLB4367 TaxID=3384767 RepID=UPI003908444F
MNLSTGFLLWPDTLPHVPVYPPLEEDTECETLVIGSGEAGALCAFGLTEAGVKTIVVDKRHIGFGSTRANTGLIQYANDKELTSCIRTFGQDKGIRFYRCCQRAVGEVGDICGKLSIDPEYVRRDSLYFASCPEDAVRLQEEYEVLIANGFPVEYLSPERISDRFSFRKAGAIYSRGDAEVNPYKLAVSLIDAAVRRGARAYVNTEIVNRREEGGRLVFVTKGNRRIVANNAVFATGYETQQIKRNPNAVLSSSFGIATQRLDTFEGWHNRCLLWETARPYLYIRTTPDNRIVAGGFDEDVIAPKERDAMLERKRDLLVKALQELFPRIPELKAEYYWSATFGSTHDGYPLIGMQEDFPGCYFALGYGGNGTAYSTIAASVITGLITKGHHPDADLFRFERDKYATATV